MDDNRSSEHAVATTAKLRHIALFVPDLQQAEQYYLSVFDMELIGREALLGDGLWYTLPHHKSWEDAKAAGIDLGMSALRKGDLVMALFRGQAVSGQIYALGLEVPAQQITQMRERLPQDTVILEEGPASLSFLDPYLITWQISTPGGEFRIAGDYADRWLLR